MRSTLTWLFRRIAPFADDRGNVAMLFALMLPVVVGGAAFGVETTYWYYKRLALQSAADAAAYSAAFERRSGANNAQVESVAAMGANDNGFDSVKGTIAVSYQNPANGGAVVVQLSEPAQRFFTAYFTSAPLTLEARAVATYNTAATACLLALHPSASKAANFSGTSDLQLTDCSVMSNSSANDALNVQGAAKLKTECVISVGGVVSTSGLTMTECSAAITQAPPVADPFKDLPPMTPTGSCKTAPSGNGNYTLSPGRYCSGIKVKGNITFQPGEYYVEGDVDFQSGAVVQGSGVTFYVTGGGHVTANGQAQVNLSAPTTGTYKGVLFFGDRSTAGGDNKFNGTAGSKMTGALYFASQQVIYNGNFSGDNGCLQVVGKTIEWTGTAGVKADCSAYGMTPIPAYNIVRLTE